MLSSRLLLALPLCTIAFVVMMSRGVRSEDEEEAFEVRQMLSELSSMMRKHYNVSHPEGSLMNPALQQEAAVSPENDMRLTKEQAENLMASMLEEMTGQQAKEKRISSRSRKWSFPIKYTFDGSHNDNEKSIIRQGIQLWETITCVRFREYSSVSKINGNGIVFKKEKGCWSYVGTVGRSPQTISLGAGCVNAGITAHEIGHALGMYHEHMRKDRDNYVRVNLNNAIAGYESAFAKTNDDIHYGSPYDFSSVMHYDSLGFSSNYWGKRRVLESRDPMFLTSMGQRSFVSFNDAKRINQHYGCTAKCSQNQLPGTCQNGGYQDPNNCAKCICPDGYGGDFCTQGKNSCGGVVNLGSCSSTVITSPTFYNAGQTCGWLVKAPSGSGLVFGLEREPGMPCTFADTCANYVEIRTSNNPMDAGYKFCKCGISTGRFTVDRNEATVFFRASSTSRTGFRLVAYATCPGTSASSLTKECVITNTGYDYAGSQTRADNSINCLAWSGQSNFEALDFPGGTLAAAGNKCRNPDGRSNPWCYTGSFSSSSSCSSIPDCPTGSVTQPTTTTTTQKPTTTTTTQKSTTTTTTQKPTTTTQRSTTTTTTVKTTTSSSGGSSTDCRKTQAGREYMGSVAVTKSGIKCQRWDNMWPHSHQFNNGNLFPDGATWKVGNKCRNPDPHYTEGVWCFTNDQSVRREACDVPMCADDAVPQRRSFNAHPMKAFWRKLFEEYNDLGESSFY